LSRGCARSSDTRRKAKPDARPACLKCHAVAFGTRHDDDDARTLHVREQAFGAHARQAAADAAECTFRTVAEMKIKHGRLPARLMQRWSPLFGTDRFVVCGFELDAHQGLVAETRQRHGERVALHVASAADQHTAALCPHEFAQQPAESPASRLHAGRTHPFELFHLHG
jgi:hypothetical protein